MKQLHTPLAVSIALAAMIVAPGAMAQQSKKSAPAKVESASQSMTPATPAAPAANATPGAVPAAGTMGEAVNPATAAVPATPAMPADPNAAPSEMAPAAPAATAAQQPTGTDAVAAEGDANADAKTEGKLAKKGKKKPH